SGRSIDVAADPGLLGGATRGPLGARSLPLAQRTPVPQGGRRRLLQVENQTKESVHQTEAAANQAEGTAGQTGGAAVKQAEEVAEQAAGAVGQAGQAPEEQAEEDAGDEDDEYEKYRGAHPELAAYLQEMAQQEMVNCDDAVRNQSLPTSAELGIGPMDAM
ncbi:hypothetical protein TSOC_000783, partial [Tetrabaena socialis]